MADSRQLQNALEEAARLQTREQTKDMFSELYNTQQNKQRFTGQREVSTFESAKYPQGYYKKAAAQVLGQTFDSLLGPITEMTDAAGVTEDASKNLAARNRAYQNALEYSFALDNEGDVFGVPTSAIRQTVSGAASSLLPMFTVAGAAGKVSSLAKLPTYARRLAQMQSVSAMFGINAGRQEYFRRINAGASEQEASDGFVESFIYEFGVTNAFNLAGAGGLEDDVVSILNRTADPRRNANIIREAANNYARQRASRLGYWTKDKLVPEVIEESTIEFLQAAGAALSGYDPAALDSENLIENELSVVAQTLLTMGSVGTLSKLSGRGSFERQAQDAVIRADEVNRTIDETPMEERAEGLAAQIMVSRGGSVADLRRNLSHLFTDEEFDAALDIVRQKKKGGTEDSVLFEEDDFIAVDPSYGMRAVLGREGIDTSSMSDSEVLTQYSNRFADRFLGPLFNEDINDPTQDGWKGKTKGFEMIPSFAKTKGGTEVEIINYNPELGQVLVERVSDREQRRFELKDLNFEFDVRPRLSPKQELSAKGEKAIAENNLRRGTVVEIDVSEEADTSGEGAYAGKAEVRKILKDGRVLVASPDGTLRKVYAHEVSVFETTDDDEETLPVGNPLRGAGSLTPTELIRALYDSDINLSRDDDQFLSDLRESVDLTDEELARLRQMADQYGVDIGGSAPDSDLLDFLSGMFTQSSADGFMVNPDQNTAAVMMADGTDAEVISYNPTLERAYIKDSEGDHYEVPLGELTLMEDTEEEEEGSEETDTDTENQEDAVAALARDLGSKYTVKNEDDDGNTWYTPKSTKDYVYATDEDGNTARVNNYVPDGDGAVELEYDDGQVFEMELGSLTLSDRQYEGEDESLLDEVEPVEGGDLPGTADRRIMDLLSERGSIPASDLRSQLLNEGYGQQEVVDTLAELLRNDRVVLEDGVYSLPVKEEVSGDTEDSSVDTDSQVDSQEDADSTVDEETVVPEEEQADEETVVPEEEQADDETVVPDEEQQPIGDTTEDEEDSETQLDADTQSAMDDAFDAEFDDDTEPQDDADTEGSAPDLDPDTQSVMDDAFDEAFEEDVEATTGTSSPSGTGGGRPQGGGRRLGERTSDVLRGKAEEARNELNSIADEIKSLLSFDASSLDDPNQPMMSMMVPVNEQLVRAVGKYLAVSVKKLGYDFAATVASLAEQLSPDQMRQITPYAKSTWMRAQDNGKIPEAQQSTVEEIDAAIAPYTQERRDGRTDEERADGAGGQDGDSASEEDAGLLGDEQTPDDQTTPEGEDAETSGDTDSDAGGGTSGGSTADGDAEVGSDADSRRRDDDGTGDGGDEGDPDSQELGSAEVRPNYVLTDPDAIIPKGAKDRFNRNMQAIDVINELDASGKPPTQAQLNILAGYTGWGALGQELFKGTWDRPFAAFGWEAEDERLRDALGQEEWESIQASIVNAHYTSPEEVSFIWSLMEKLGLDPSKENRILEPAIGIGGFFSMMPRKYREKSRLTGIDKDNLSARIAAVLHPQATVKEMDFARFSPPDNFYDLIISNVPFLSASAGKVNDRRYKEDSPRGYMLHNYYFRKSFDALKPGGVMAFITSSGTMDGKVEAKNNLRDLITKNGGDLVAAYRFPAGQFSRFAGTGVMADLVIIQKRKEGQESNGIQWSDIVTVNTETGDVQINEYWESHPDHIFGNLKLGRGGTRQGMTATVDVVDGEFERLSQKALEESVADIIDTVPDTKDFTIVDEGPSRPTNSIMKNDKGELSVWTGSGFVPLSQKYSWAAGVSDSVKAERLAELSILVDLREAFSEVLDRQSKGLNADAARKRMNDAYDEYRGRYRNAIAKSKAMQIFKAVGDPIGPALGNLEIIDGKKKRKSQIFSKSTVRMRKAIENPNVAQAYSIHRNESFDFSIDRVAELANKTVEEVAEELVKSGDIVKTASETYLPADEYFSGETRRKLQELIEAKSQGVKGLDSSIERMREVVPKDVPHTEIGVSMGATWVPADYYKDFIYDFLNYAGDESDLKISYINGKWEFETPRNWNSSNRAVELIAEPNYPAAKILSLAMNPSPMPVPVVDGRPDTEAAERIKGKVESLREAFQDWVWGNAERIEKLSKEYNYALNPGTPRSYDNVPLDFDGMALSLSGDPKDPFVLRPHQQRAIWKAVSEGSGIYGHEVGTGKTFTMGGIAMESKRLGKASKTIMFALNANAADVAADIQMQYPNSKVAFVDGTASSANFAKQAVSLMNDDYDLVVFPHSFVTSFAYKEETLEEFIQQEIDEFNKEIAAQLESEGRAVPRDLNLITEATPRLSKTAKDMVKARNAIASEIRKLASASKERAFYFEDFGFDQVIVDEAHKFKKIDLKTRMDVRGLNTVASKQARALNLITKNIQRVNDGRGVYLFTGTPITNTLNEIFNLAKLASPHVLERAGIGSWDGFFQSFASTVNNVEVAPGGEWRMLQRLTQFKNLPELRALLEPYLDVVFADEVIGVRENREGKTKDAEGLPYKKVVNEASPMTEEQEQGSADLRDRYQQYQNLPGNEKIRAIRGDEELRHLSPMAIDQEGARLALDPRLVGMDVDPKDPNLKINRMVSKAMDHYNEEELTTQFVFLDQGLSGVRSETQTVDGNKVKVEYPQFNVAKEIRKRLIEEGVAPEEIGIIASKGEFKKTAQQKRELVKKMREGKIRFLIGSTESIGTGVNAQKHCRAMHQMDCPWMPGELDQRNGRGRRQGNDWNTVFEYRYITEMPQDERRWNVVLTKDRFIKAFLQATTERVVEIENDMVDQFGGFEQTMATAATDQRHIQVIKYRQEVNDLLRSKARQVAAAERELQNAVDAQSELEELEPRLEKLKRLQELYRERKAEQDSIRSEQGKSKWVIEIEGEEYESPGDAKAPFQSVMARADLRNRSLRQQKLPPEPFSIGRYFGFDLVTFGQSVFIKDGDELMAEVAGNSLGSVTARMQQTNAVKYLERSVATAKGIVARAEALAERPFSQEDRLIDKRGRLVSLLVEINDSPAAAPSWLRHGASPNTSVFVDGEERIVVGYRGAKEVLTAYKEDEPKEDPELTIDDINKAIKDSGYEVLRVGNEADGFRYGIFKRGEASARFGDHALGYTPVEAYENAVATFDTAVPPYGWKMIATRNVFKPIPIESLTDQYGTLLFPVATNEVSGGPIPSETQQSGDENIVDGVDFDEFINDVREALEQGRLDDIQGRPPANTAALEADIQRYDDGEMTLSQKREFMSDIVATFDYDLDDYRTKGISGKRILEIGRGNAEMLLDQWDEYEDPYFSAIQNATDTAREEGATDEQALDAGGVAGQEFMRLWRESGREPKGETLLSDLRSLEDTPQDDDDGAVSADTGASPKRKRGRRLGRRRGMADIPLQGSRGVDGAVSADTGKKKKKSTIGPISSENQPSGAAGIPFGPKGINTDIQASIGLDNRTPGAPVFSDIDDRPGVAAQDLIKTLDRIFGVTSRVARLKGRSKIGEYMGLSATKNVSRVLSLDEQAAISLATKIHEVGHHIDRVFGIVTDRPASAVLGKGKPRAAAPQHVMEELETMDVNGMDVFEGWAEFIRLYISEPSIVNADGEYVSGAAIHAPHTHEWFMGYLDKNKDLKAQINEAKNYFKEFRQQSLIRKMRAMIGDKAPADLSYKERKRAHYRKLINKTYTYLFDDISIAGQIDKSFFESGGRGAGLRDTIQAYYLVAPRNAQRAMHEGVFVPHTGEKVGGDGLVQILQDNLQSDQEYEDAQVFAWARHTVWCATNKPKYNTGMSPFEANRILQEIKKEDPAKYKRFEKVAKGISDYAHALLRMRVKSGAADAKDVEKVIKKYGDFYFPMQRVTDGKTDYAGSGGTSYLDVPMKVRARSMTGSGRPPRNPFVQMIEQTHEYYNIASRARVNLRLQSMIDPRSGGVEGMGWVGRRIEAKARPNKFQLQEIRKQLFDAGVIDEDDIKAEKIARKIRKGKRVKQEDVDFMMSYAEEEGKSSDGQSVLEVANSIADYENFLRTWSVTYKSDPGKLVAVSYDQQGKKFLMEYDEEVYKMLSGSTGAVQDGAMKIAREYAKIPAKLFTAATVSANIKFGMMNAVLAFVTYQFRANKVRGFNTVTDVLKAVGYVGYAAKSYKDRDKSNVKSEYILFEEFGGETLSIVGRGRSERARNRNLRDEVSSAWRSYGDIAVDLTSIEGIGSAARRLTGKLGGALSYVEKIVASMEAPVRIAEMVESIKQDGWEPMRGGKWKRIGMDDSTATTTLPEEVKIKAIQAAAEADVNFKTGGQFSKKYDPFMPFLNAQVASIVRFGRELKNLGKQIKTGDIITGSNDDEDVRKARRYAIGLALMAAYSYVHALMRSEDEDFIDDDDWRKNKYWTYGDGELTYLRVPKPRDEAIVCNLAEILALNLAGKVEQNRGAIETLVDDSLVKLVPSGGGIIKGAGEVILNKDAFKDQQIEPDYLKDRSRYNRFNDRTTAISKGVSKLLSQTIGKLGFAYPSPMQMDHLLNSGTGNLYKRAMDIYDEPQKVSAAGAFQMVRNVAGGNAFLISRRSSKSVSDFYDKIGELKVLRNDLDTEGASSQRINEVSAQLSELNDYRAMMSAIYDLRREDPEGLMDYDKYIAGIARDALGYEKHRRSVSPLTLPESELPEDIANAVKEFVKDRAGQAIRLGGIPMVVPEKEEEGTRLFDLRSERRDAIDARLDFIEANIDRSPMMREYLKKEMRSRKWSSTLYRRLDRGGKGFEMTSSEFRQDLDRHREQQRRIRRIKDML